MADERPRCCVVDRVVDEIGNKYNVRCKRVAAIIRKDGHNRCWEHWFEWVGVL